MELLKLAVVVIFTAILMWRKVDLGISLLTGAIFTGILFGMTTYEILNSIKKSAFDAKTLELLGAVFIILGMGKYMSAGKTLERMVDALEKIIRDRRIAMVIPPALIGLLPTPGGAMLSAPMVDESGSKLGITPEQKTYINFWFRHLWEYCWPIYPGLIIAAIILEVPIRNIMREQYLLTGAAIIAGSIFGLMPIKNGKIKNVRKESIGKSLLTFNISIWQIWVILIGLVVFKLPILVILSIIFIIMAFSPKIELKQKWILIKQVLSWKIALLLLSAMIFKQIVMDSSAVTAVPASLESSGVSPYFMLFIIPFIVGILTGVNQAYVGVGFPLLLQFFGIEVVDLKLVMFAYTAGFIGVLISPVHLCLLLTKEYFNAEWGGIYRLMMPSVLIIFIASLILLVV